MFPATKHFDQVLGTDTHIILLPTPAGPVPTPVPHPFVGILFDPVDYVPMIGATVSINGLPRAHAGTAVVALPPHIPMGGPFAKPPGNEGQLFMGSATVAADGEPLGYAALPVLTCQDIGMPAPFRRSKTTTPKSLLLPTSVVIPIPSAPLVLVGGPPTISIPTQDELAVSFLGARLKKALGKTKLAQKIDRKLKGGEPLSKGKSGPRSGALGMSQRRNRAQSRAPRDLHGHGPSRRRSDRQSVYGFRRF